MTRAAVIALCSLIALVDALAPDDTVLIGLLVTGPLLAALRASSRTTALAAAYAVALAVLLGWPDEMFLTADHLMRVLVLAIASALAILLARTREGLERARFADSLVADAGVALTSSLDWEQTFPEIARLATESLAEWCAIDVLEEDGSPRRVAFARRDPERASEPDADVLTLPMVARGRVLGAISLGAAGRGFQEADHVLVEELAGRCGLALDNARLFRERSRIARTLQASLLPPMLPDLPGLDLAARFRAAGEGLEVGGDFYDLFETGDAGWAFAIGDVCGKGSEAAAITALARYTVRAAAMHQEAPSQILAVLNEALLRQRTDKRFCTVLYGRLERNGSGHLLEFASGGHPLPLVLRAGEPGGEVGTPGTLLGIVPDPELPDQEVSLGPGDAGVLYTDGVTDSAAPARVWSAADLAAAVGSTAGLDADSIAERVMAAALSEGVGEPRDDIAILVLKVPDQG